MTYSKINLDELDDQAAAAGIQSQEARFARRERAAERIGIAHYRVRPGQRLEFGHRHRSMEEAYVVLSGSGAFRVDDDTFEVGAYDVVRVTPESWRGWEAGPDGMEVLAVGEHVEGDGESEMDMEWWPRR
jgi:mannose-6-phosphate isomerase-like protein (cupin superfamily)